MSARYYPIDGRGHNSEHPEFGASGQLYAFRVAPNGYADNRTEPRTAGRASTRRVSVGLTRLPFRFNTKANANAWFPSFGQWLAHDVSAGDTRTGPWLNISVDRCDAVFDRNCTGSATLAFVRQGGPVDADGLQRAVNANTAWIDCSTIYGHDADTLAGQRTGTGGQLRTSASTTGERLLPFRDGYGFVSGDGGVNSNPQLLLVETLFHLEHNRVAVELAHAHPDWDDETLFQEARRRVIAINQKITYKEVT
jgi:peroxidase